MSTHSLAPRPDPELQALLQREGRLAEHVRRLEASHAGLRDLDAWLQLAAVRLTVAVLIIQELHDGGTPILPPEERAHGECGEAESPPSAARAARTRVQAAVGALEELRLMNVSEDQRHLLEEAPTLGEIRALLERFVALGGGALLEEETDDPRSTRLVARAVVEAVRKFAAPESDYPQAFKAERLPPLLRRVVLFFWPILAREGQQDPPYGILEGEEVLLSAPRMKMPLSQAVYYLENELLPHLESELAAEPGSPAIQRRLQLARERLREYRNIRSFPRATPINLEHGFYTDWLSHYTEDGELVVTVELPVQMRSGTNLDRLREYIQADVVRRLAGRGVSAELDADYRFRRSLESGRRGSSRLPSRKVDVHRGFIALREAFPVLQRLEDRAELLRLVQLVRSAGPRKAEKLLADPDRGDRVRGLLHRLPDSEA